MKRHTCYIWMYIIPGVLDGYIEIEIFSLLMCMCLNVFSISNSLI